jgi:hypothetical protein
VNGKRIIPGETFHTDHSNHPRPPKATMLFAVELPSSGGDTQYVNMHDAYAELPENTKQRIHGLKAVHVYLSKYSPRSLGHITEDSRRNLPPPGIHPLVRTHPENGRKARMPRKTCWTWRVRRSGAWCALHSPSTPVGSLCWISIRFLCRSRHGRARWCARSLSWGCDKSGSARLDWSGQCLPTLQRKRRGRWILRARC